jgi:hypothetical protein
VPKTKKKYALAVKTRVFFSDVKLHIDRIIDYEELRIVMEPNRRRGSGCCWAAASTNWRKASWRSFRNCDDCG